MGLIDLIVVLIVVGVLLYLVQLIPMDATIKRIIVIVVILFVVLWLLQALGLFSAGRMRLGGLT
jgi:hypothetical protein